MRSWSLTHLSDGELRRSLSSAAARERTSTAMLLAHLAEFDARKLYLSEGYASMHAYCDGALKLSEDATWKRIQAARLAIRFPQLLDTIADGRLHLSGACLLAPHLTQENAAALLSAVAHRSKAEIELLIAERFPRTESLPLVQALPAVSNPTVNAMSREPAPGQVMSKMQASRATPIARDRVLWNVSVAAATHDKYRRIRELLSHELPSGDMGEVLDRMADLALAALEKRTCRSTERPQRHPRVTRSARHIPAHVVRAVRERDGNGCTFVGPSGHRCASRRFIELDHIVPVARGGESTVENLMLRCRAHNQHLAERAFGAGFMTGKRSAARQAAAERAEARRVAQEQAAGGTAARHGMARDPERDVVPWLRAMGVRPDLAGRASDHCDSLPEVASLETRVREGLAFVARMRFRLPPRLPAAPTATTSPG